MQKDDANCAFKLFILLFAHVTQLICDIFHVDFEQPTRLKQRNLILNPAEQIILVGSARTRRGWRTAVDSFRRHHLCPVRFLQLSATLTELSVSSALKQR